MCKGRNRERERRRQMEREMKRAQQRAADERRRFEDSQRRAMQSARDAMNAVAMRARPEPVPEPVRATPAPEPIVGSKGQTSGRLVRKRQQRATRAARARGSNRLRIPVNIAGSSRGGGVNVG